MEKEIHLEYFAMLREQAQKKTETIITKMDSAETLYLELRDKYDFSLQSDRLAVAINDSFQDMQTQLQDGDKLVFIPPVAGG